MAITKNFLLKKISGRVGTDIVYKQYGDKTVLSKYPDMGSRELSEKQKQNNLRMEEANYYALGIMGDEAKKDEAQVRLNVTRNKLYTSLVREYFKQLKEGEKK
ncbi:hypothetical protein MD537_11065 [Flavihumibacter sediminis]|nr:hypothetical protein [Flavihumibacter sediminis]